MNRLKMTLADNNKKYVDCPNHGMGSTTMHKGRAVLKCKRGCNYFYSIEGNDLMCGWEGRWIRKRSVIPAPESWIEEY
jgi:hypothetical protein